MPAGVKLYLWLHALSAGILVATAYGKTWIWEPFVILTAPWALLRSFQLWGQRWGEGDEAARNRNTGRTRTPKTVHIISAVIGLVIVWWAAWGWKYHPLPNMR